MLLSQRWHWSIDRKSIGGRAPPLLPCDKIHGFSGLIVEHLHVKFGDPSCIGLFLRHRADKQTDRLMPVKTVPSTQLPCFQYRISLTHVRLWSSRVVILIQVALNLRPMRRQTYVEIGLQWKQKARTRGSHRVKFFPVVIFYVRPSL